MRKVHVAQISDEQLFEQYRSGGDRTAIRTLIERHVHDLLAFLTRMVGDRAGAEDVFQETFLQIHQSMDTFDTTRRFRPWLFTIAANKARDMLRKRVRRQEVRCQMAAGDSHANSSLPAGKPQSRRRERDRFASTAPASFAVGPSLSVSRDDPRHSFSSETGK